MNWEAVGAVAELLGSLGVIASLIYLGTQIRDTRRALRSSTYQLVRQDIHTALASAITTPEMSRIVPSAFDGIENLKEGDFFLFGMWITGVFQSYEHCHYQYRVGMLDAERWRMHRGILSFFLRQPGVAQWWRAGKRTNSMYSPEFVGVVLEILDESPAGNIS